VGCATHTRTRHVNRCGYCRAAETLITEILLPPPDKLAGSEGPLLGRQLPVNALWDFYNDTERQIVYQ
jgi:hypothetical protein